MNALIKWKKFSSQSLTTQPKEQPYPKIIYFNMDLIFIKLGGSVITDKTKTMHARVDVIKRLAKELSEAIEQNAELKIVLGHGSGSFGHSVASKFNFKNGDKDKNAADKIHQAAYDLHKIVMQEFSSSIPAISTPPDSNSLKATLTQGKIPVVYGDIVGDGLGGFKILSTEQIFHSLINDLGESQDFTVKQILMVSDVDGFYKDEESADEIFEKINRGNQEEVVESLGSAKGADVTGGMLHKLEVSLDLAEQGISTVILNGLKINYLKQVLLKEKTKCSLVGKTPQEL
jgi:isopentenyl phosphate kinase